MSTKIFKVLSNIKFGDILHKAGAIIEGEYESLVGHVEAGVLEVVKGAETVEDAEEIVSKEKEEAGVEAPAEKTVEPENTWGAKPDVAPEVTTPSTETVANVIPPVTTEVNTDATAEVKTPAEVATGEIVNAPTAKVEDKAKEL